RLTSSSYPQHSIIPRHGFRKPHPQEKTVNEPVRSHSVWSPLLPERKARCTGKTAESRGSSEGTRGEAREHTPRRCRRSRPKPLEYIYAGGIYCAKPT